MTSVEKNCEVDLKTSIDEDFKVPNIPIWKLRKMKKKPSRPKSLTIPSKNTFGGRKRPMFLKLSFDENRRKLVIKKDSAPSTPKRLVEKSSIGTSSVFMPAIAASLLHSSVELTSAASPRLASKIITPSAMHSTLVTSCPKMDTAVHSCISTVSAGFDNYTQLNDDEEAKLFDSKDENEQKGDGANDEMVAPCNSSPSCAHDSNDLDIVKLATGGAITDEVNVQCNELKNNFGSGCFNFQSLAIVGSELFEAEKLKSIPTTVEEISDGFAVDSPESGVTSEGKENDTNNLKCTHVSEIKSEDDDVGVISTGEIWKLVAVVFYS